MSLLLRQSRLLSTAFGLVASFCGLLAAQSDTAVAGLPASGLSASGTAANRAAATGPIASRIASRKAADPIDAETRAAIARGLTWLEQSQGKNGSWRNAGGYGTYPVAMTSLAGMALLGSGSTPTRGQRWRAVRRAAAFVIGEADGATGRLVSGGAEGRPMYGHGFGTMFLASVYGMEEGRRQKALVKSALDGAVKLIAASQNRAGGWWYQHDDGRDEGSVTITQIQALRACRMAGIVVDKRVIDRAVSYMKRCQNPDGGIRYQLEPAGTASLPAITAAGVAVFYNAGVYDDQAFVDAAVGFCKSQLKVELDTTGHHFYAHLYWSQALYQRGGPDWDDYYARACTWLKKRQRKDGSWQGGGVGPVYGTSVALTILQLPDSLVPIYQR